jgi:endonuclease YncB( thermonuclease family)
MTRPLRMLARIAHLGAALLLGACGPQVQAANWTGVVTHVTDGDTFWVRPDDGQSPPRKVRLEGIDAPEICQPHGDDAAQALARRVLRQPVHLATRATDDYHRTLARVTVKGEDVGA